MFCPQVWRALTWTPPEHVWAEVVDGCIRRGMLDTTFFVGLVLFEPSRYARISLLASHFGGDTTSLLSVKRSILSRRWVSGLILLLAGAALGALISFGVAQGFLAEERATKETIKSNYWTLQAILSAQVEECHELYGRESESCALLDQAIQGISPSECASREAGNSKEAGTNTSNLREASEKYRNARQETYRRTREELLVCQERLAKAVAMREQGDIQCPACSPEKKKACRFERGRWQANGTRIVKCELVNDLDVIQLLDLEGEMAVRECRHVPGSGDEELLEVPTGGR